MSYPELHRAYSGDGMPHRGFMAAGGTGTIAALADGVLWTFRNPEDAAAPLLIQRLLSWTINIAAFSTAITAGRGLELVRMTPDAPGAANPSGGAEYVAVPRDSVNTAEQVGVGRIATTGVLTVTGYTASIPLRQHILLNLGGAGSGLLRDWQFDTLSDPLVLRPGELLAIRSRQAFDAGGTFQFFFELEGVEVIE